MTDFRKRRTGREGIHTRIVADKRRLRKDQQTIAELWEQVGEDLAQALSKNPGCPECGSVMAYGERDDSFEYKGVINSYMMLAWWCTSCPEAIFSGKPLADREEAYLEFKRKVDEDD